MIYDENKEGKIVDSRYVNEDLITHYKLVCENDIDINSFSEMDYFPIPEFIEVGLKSKTEREALQEVKTLLQKHRIGLEGQFPKNNYEILMDRIDCFSGFGGRPEQNVIKEHLVGTTEDDPIIEKMKRYDKPKL